jgi:hypothetical protein
MPGKALKFIGGAFVTGFYWALPAAIVAFFIEAFVDPHGEIVDIWPAVLCYPAFAGGVIFFTLLRVIEGRRTFGEISLARAAVLGGLSALALTMFFALLVAASGGWNEGMEPSRRAMALAFGGLSITFAIAGWITVRMARSMAAAITGTRT